MPGFRSLLDEKMDPGPSAVEVGATAGGGDTTGRATGADRMTQNHPTYDEK